MKKRLTIILMVMSVLALGALACITSPTAGGGDTGGGATGGGTTGGGATGGGTTGGAGTAITGGSSPDQCATLTANQSYTAQMHTSSGSYPENCEYYCVTVPEGSSQADITLSGLSVDLDMFVQANNPVFTSDPDAAGTWTSNEFGTVDEQVSISSPDAGTYYIEICSYEGTGGPYNLNASVR